MPTDKLFTGQRLDSCGLYYYNARYYDPAIGRFISADTIIPNPADPQCFNRYSYCVNNPLKYIDPSGHDFDWYAYLMSLASQHDSGRDVATETADVLGVLAEEAAGTNSPDNGPGEAAREFVEERSEQPDLSDSSSSSPIDSVTSLPGEIIGGIGIYGNSPISNISIIDVGIAGKSGDTRYFHIDYGKVRGSQGLPVDHFNATSGPLARYNHTRLPKGTFSVFKGLTKALPVISLVVDGVNIGVSFGNDGYTFGPQTRHAVGHAAGGWAGAAIGAAIGTAIYPGAGTIIGGIIGGIAGSFGGDWIAGLFD